MKFKIVFSVLSLISTLGSERDKFPEVIILELLFTNGYILHILYHLLDHVPHLNVLLCPVIVTH